MIPFLDLKAINQRFELDFNRKFQDFLDTGYYVLGSQVKAFESSFASYCGADYCVGVGNGLDALRLILEAYKALGKLQDGDEVLVASNTYIATILAIKQAGLIPVLVEAENITFNFQLLALKIESNYASAFIWAVVADGRNKCFGQKIRSISPRRCRSSSWC